MTHYPTLLLSILDSYYPRTNSTNVVREILSDLVTIRFKKPQGGKQNLTCIAIKNLFPTATSKANEIEVSQRFPILQGWAGVRVHYSPGDKLRPPRVKSLIFARFVDKADDMFLHHEG